MKTRDLTIGGVLTALAIVIPIVFGPYKVIIGPFSATLTSHVPMFLSMLISPTVALMVGIGSALGFLITSTPVIAARAATHIAAGLLGAVLIKKGYSAVTAFAAALPVHAVLEALVVIPFGFTLDKIIITVGIGTALHHTVDAAIAVSILYALKPFLRINPVRSR